MTEPGTATAAAGEAGTRAPLRILFATDGSPEAEAGAELLRILPLPAGSAIQVATVLDAPVWQVPVSLLGAEQEWARRVVEAASTAQCREGVRVERLVRRGAAAAEIIQASREFQADLILLGARGHTALEQFLLGSVARNVIKHAGRPVLIARAPEQGLRNVVLALDESSHAAEAVEFLARLPLPEGARVTLAHVVRPGHPYPAMGADYVPELDQMAAEYQAWQHEQAEKLLAGCAEKLRGAGLTTETAVREGDPATEVLRLAREQGADLVVAGARGLSPIQGLLVGSVADRLTKSCPVSLLLVH